MKKIVAIFCLLASLLFVCQPQADAGAIAVIPMDAHTDYPMMTQDEEFRKEIVDIVKKHAPYGYTINCSYDVDKSYFEARDNGYWRKDYAYTYGYDYVILIYAFDPYVETTHFRHPRASLDIHELYMDMTGVFFTKDWNGYNYHVGNTLDDNHTDYRLDQLQDAVFRKDLERIMEVFGNNMKMDNVGKPKTKISEILW